MNVTVAGFLSPMSVVSFHFRLLRFLRDGMSPGIVSFFLAVVLGASGMIQAVEAQELRSVTDPLISVSGDAEVKVTPDHVELALGVETFDRDLTQAKQTNDERMKAFLSAMRAAGVAEADLRTDFLQIEPTYNHGTYSERILQGYVVRNSVVVTVRAVERFEELLSTALALGINHVHGIQFKTSKLREHRDRARADAVRAAREKAQALAAELGQEIGTAFSISEQQSWWGMGSRGWWGGFGGGMMQAQNMSRVNGGDGSEGAEGSSTAIGQISVRATVQASFYLLGASK